MVLKYLQIRLSLCIHLTPPLSPSPLFSKLNSFLFFGLNLSMGRITKFRDLIGVIKDKASLSKAALLSKSNTLSLHLAVLRATTHSPSTTPDDHHHHISTLLSLGDSSRATASAIIESLMDRLHRTGDASVALKCLLTIHHIIKRGPFILQDQLSVFPATGGHNYLKLSSFRDGGTATTWLLSAWVRWYARYLETLLSTSRDLGFFVCSSSCSIDRQKQLESIISSTNVDLIRTFDSLAGVIEELCKVPDSLLLQGNKLLYEVMVLLGNDFLLAVNEIELRLTEFKGRLSHLTFDESVDLVCNLNRLDNYKEKLLPLFTASKPSIDPLWGLVEELKSKVGMVKVERESGKLLTMGKKGRVTESTRFGERVEKSINSVKFSSTRYGLNEFSFTMLESMESTICL